MADAVSRVTSGQKIGVFAMQHGPGTENAFGGVAQAYGDSVPIVVLPGGYPRRIDQRPAELQRVPQLPARHQVVRAGRSWPTRCRTRCAAPSPRCRNGRPRPVLVEIPADVMARGGAGAARLHAGAAHALGARSRRRWPRSPSAGRGRAAGDLRRPGRALRAGLARSCASWPSCSRRRSPPASRARAPSRRTIRCRSARAAARSRSRSHDFLHERRRHLRHRLQLRAPPTTASPMPKGKTHHPRHARPGRPQQGRRRSSTRWSATPG